jgi:hypothetical protein
MLDLKEASQSQHPNHTPVRYRFFNLLEGSTQDGNHCGIPKSSKARLLAIPFVESPIRAIVAWLNTILPWILAPFENREISAVGDLPRIRNLKTGAPIKQCYNLFGAVYIVRRNFEISATHTH